jgi:uncharacterized protein
VPSAPRMRKAALDSSVLVSAFLSPQGTTARLLTMAGRGAFVMACSPPILDETAGVLLRPRFLSRYGHSALTVRRYIEAITTLSDLVIDLPDLMGAVPLDPKDDMVVATAVAAGAEVLVTGDRRHLLSLGRYRAIRILGPREFLDELAAAGDDAAGR